MPSQNGLHAWLARSQRSKACASLALALASFGEAAAAQAVESVPSAPAPPANAPSLSPPKLIEAPEPAFPPPAREAGLTHALVVLRLTVDGDGNVSAAEVTEPVGHGFDEAATRAAYAYRFEPARRGDVAVTARILVSVAFRLPAPANADAIPAAPPVAAAEPPRVPAEQRPESVLLAAAAPRAQVEVTVHGQSDAERTRRSSDAVHVVETETARRQAADLGEVLARTQGVGVQRSGGLGSDTRFSLNGLTDDQVRFFLDGLPLELAGYPFGVANVPVNLVERAEIYRGVMPIRFGADALGGGVNLVSDNDIQGTHASGSLLAGSFGTYRATLSARHLHAPSGWFTRVNAFLDRSDNDYPMDDIVVADAQGHPIPQRVYRFHDAYTAEGANIETGVVNEPWARRLLLRAFITHDEKEIQHNLLMTFNPYGDVTLAETSAGGSLRYENTFARRVVARAVAGYAYREQAYEDVGECVYNWFGQCLRQRAQPGERLGRAQDQRYREYAGFARLNADLQLASGHTLGFSSAPMLVERTGEERRRANREARDPLSAERRLVTVVSGVDYKLELFGGAFENTSFVKDYLQVLHSEDPLTDLFRKLQRTTHRFGLGDALRYTLADWVYAKASYEWATRLPTPDEIFGNAFPVRPNLQLEPELSHNLNLGVTLDKSWPSAGKFRGDVNGFLRRADQLIVLVGDDQAATYRNVFSARSLGMEVAGGWTSPGDYLALDGNLTWVDFRNDSSEGAFADYDGDRIPNRPYLFGTGSARLQKSAVASANDELSFTWTTRYVHEFYRGWEGLGTDKLTVPKQVVHGAALTYLVRGKPAELSFSGEAQNVTDTAAFDVFGVPRPGRAFYFKATASL